MPFDGGQYQGKNFAPVAPLSDARKTLKDGSSSSMSAFFREIYDEINRPDEAREQAIETGRIISQLRAGKLIMKDNLSRTGKIFLPPLGRDRSNYPIFPQISEDLKSKWQKAQPTMQARHFGDGYKTEIQLNEINTIVKSYFKDIFTPQYELNEALSAQDFGTYITRFYYDDRLNQIRQIAPILKNQSKVLVAGFGACYDCPFEGAPEEFQKTGAPVPQCPGCGSFRTTKMLAPTVVDEQTIVDAEEIVQGDISGKLIPFPAYRYDPRVLPHESSYGLYKQFVPLRLAQAMLGDLDIHEESYGSDLGLEVMESLASRGGSIEGYGSNSIYGSPETMGKRAVMAEMWLKPEWYTGFKLDRPEKTVSGTIPANVPFEKLFPEGLCVVGFNDMRLQTGYYAETPNIVGGVYLIQSFSGIGKPMSDGVDIAKDLSELHSMTMAQIKRFGAGGIAFDKSAGLSQTDIKKLFKPDGAVGVDLKANGFTDIRQVINKVDFSPVNRVLPDYTIQLSNLLNLVNLSGDFSEGAVQSVDINTLGGQQLATAKEEGKKGAILSMKVFHRQLSAETITKLFRRHIKIPRYYAARTDQHAATKGKWIAGHDFPENIKFDAVADSEIPANAFEKRMATKEMIREAGGIGALMQSAAANPRITAWYAEQFNTELPTLNQEEIWLVCLSRLDSIKRNSEMFDDPAEVLAQMSKPLFVREFGHLLKAEFLGQILDDDEVETWNPVARAAAQMLIEQHYEMQAQAAFQDESLKQQVAMKLQAQGQQAQQQMMQPQIDAQNATAADAQKTQLLTEAAGRVADDAQKETDHERSLETKEADHARAMELEQMRQKHQLNPKLLRGKQ